MKAESSGPAHVILELAIFTSSESSMLFSAQNVNVFLCSRHANNQCIVVTAEDLRQTAKDLFHQCVGRFLKGSRERRKIVDKFGGRRTVDVKSLLFRAWGLFSRRAGTAYS